EFLMSFAGFVAGIFLSVFFNYSPLLPVFKSIFHMDVISGAYLFVFKQLFYIFISLAVCQPGSEDPAKSGWHEPSFMSFSVLMAGKRRCMSNLAVKIAAIVFLRFFTSRLPRKLGGLFV